MKQKLPFKFFTVFLFLFLAGLYTFAQSTVFISEIADPKDNINGRFVQLYNSGTSAIDLSAGNYYLVKQVNGGNYYDMQLSGSINPGGVYVAAVSSDFSTIYGFNPDITNGRLNANGDDAYFLYSGGNHSTGTLIDVYGVRDEDGTGKAWEYTDGTAIRNSNIGTPDTTWSASEWTITSPVNVADITPGQHTYNSGGDATPPTWSTGYPKAPIVEDTRAVFSVKMSEKGTAYFIVVLHGSAAPTSTQVKAGSNYGSVTVYYTDSISVTSPEIPFSAVVTGVTANTSYDIWFVAKDASGNLQTSPTSINVTTTNTRSLSFVNPSANNEYSIGGTIDVKWNSANVDSVLLGVHSFTSGQFFRVSSNPIAGSSGMYKLVVPSEADTGNYTFYIMDYYDTTFYDTVSPIHLVDNRKLAWVQPQPNDTVYVGDTITFKWTSDKIDSVLIGGYNYTQGDSFMITGDLDHTDKSYWKPVAASAGIYKFYLSPAMAGGNYKLAISLYDAADTSFKVTVDPVFIQDTLPLTLVSSAPFADMNDFPVTASISCSFSADSIIPGTGKVHIKNADGTTYEDMDVSNITFQGNNFYFMPSPQLIAGNSYYIELDAGLVKNADGSKIYDGLSGTSLSFKVATSGLFFSEYVEGSHNNKALELYNNTGHDINLDEYMIGSSYNGGGLQSDFYTFPAGTVLKSGKVFVLANSQADPAILAVANDTLVYNEGGYVMSFNGNDARVLIRIMNNGYDWAWIDAIGDPNQDPGSGGWDVAGNTGATMNHTLLRKSIINIGTTDWPTSSGSDTDNSQWIVKNEDDFSNLGLPTPSPAGINNIMMSNKVSLYPNPGNGIFNIRLNNVMNGAIVVKVIDVTGRIIFEKTYNQIPNEIPVNISSFASNMYFVQINDNDNFIVKRFIKK